MDTVEARAQLSDEELVNRWRTATDMHVGTIVGTPVGATLEAAELLTARAVVIGEGTSFDEWRDLLDDLLTLAERKVHVICRSPVGQFELPSPAEHGSLIGHEFRTTDRLRTIDKRFSVENWLNGSQPPHAMMLRSAGKSVVVEFGQKHGWHWFELKFANQARIIFCSVGLNNQWDSSPVPRHLLARMLADLRI